MAQSLGEVREAALAQVGSMNVGEGLLPTLGYNEQSGRLHVEIDERGYHYVVCERGSKFERQTTIDPKEPLDWICSNVTYEDLSVF